MNMCYNCVDRHVDAGNGAHTALIWDSPVTDSPPYHMSFNELQDKVCSTGIKLAYVISCVH